MGNVISHTLVGIVSALIMFGLIAGAVWFGGPRIVNWVVEGEKAKAEVTSLRQQLADLQTKDTAAANAAARQCSARVADARQSAALISRMVAPRPVAAGQQAGVGNASILQLVGQAP
jgi:hypothetical protein